MQNSLPARAMQESEAAIEEKGKRDQKRRPSDAGELNGELLHLLPHLQQVALRRHGVPWLPSGRRHPVRVGHAGLPPHGGELGGLQPVLQPAAGVVPPPEPLGAAGRHLVGDVPEEVVEEARVADVGARLLPQRRARDGLPGARAVGAHDGEQRRLRGGVPGRLPPVDHAGRRRHRGALLLLLELLGLGSRELRPLLILLLGTLGDAMATDTATAALPPPLLLLLLRRGAHRHLVFDVVVFFCRRRLLLRALVLGLGGARLVVVPRGVHGAFGSVVAREVVVPPDVPDPLPDPPPDAAALQREEARRHRLRRGGRRRRRDGRGRRRRRQERLLLLLGEVVEARGATGPEVAVAQVLAGGAAAHDARGVDGGGGHGSQATARERERES